MRKWTYLVAALLLVGATATFTGCIDNDEPAGIENLRGAKAELLKAKSAVELANAAYIDAQTQHELVLKAGEELKNKTIEIDNQIKALDVELKQLDVELAQAQNEAVKAQLEAQIAQSKLQKAQAENNLALAAEKFKADMLVAQTATANAQESYDNAMKLIEASKLLLSDNEKLIIGKAQNYLDVASTDLNSKYNAMVKAQQMFDSAVTDKTVQTLAGLQATLDKLNAQKDAQTVSIAEQEKILAMASDFDAANWDAEKAKLEARIQKAKVSRDSSAVIVTALKQGEKYKAALATVTDKKAALGTSSDKGSAKTAYGVYNKAKTDYVTANVTDQVEIKAMKPDVTVSSGLKKVFADQSFSAPVGYDVNKGTFSYAGGKYTLKAYADDIENKTTKTSAAKTKAEVANWIKEIGKFSVDANGVEWGKLQLEKDKKDAETKKTAYDKAIAAWTITANAVKGKATTVPTTDFVKAVKAYNDAYAKLGTALDAYNKSYDAVYTKAYNDKLAELKEAQAEKDLISQYVEDIIKKSDQQSFWQGLTPVNKTLKEAEVVISGITKINGKKVTSGDVAKLVDAAKTKAAKVTATYLDTKDGNGVTNLQKLEKSAVVTASNAWNGTENDKNKTALKNAYIDANDALLITVKGDSKVVGLNKAYSNFSNLANNFYGQVLTSKAKTVEDQIGKSTDAFYIKEVKEDPASTTTPKATYETGHLVLNSAKHSDFTDAEVTASTPTELKEDVAKNALALRSADAFGATIYDWSAADNETRLLEVTEAMVKAHMALNPTNTYAKYGAIGAMMSANDKVQLDNDMIGASDEITALKTTLEGVQTSLQAEIDANAAKLVPYAAAMQAAKDDVDAAKAAVTAAEEARDAITKDAQDAQDKYNNLMTSLNTILGDLNTQVGDICAGKTSAQEWVASQKETIAVAKEALESINSQIAGQEKAIDLFKEGKYTHAYIVAQAELALKTATDAHKAALAVYNVAMSNVDKVLETLTK